jgi:exopolysaccharide biosynthesis WecB/TagA/CpsF family protein
MCCERAVQSGQGVFFYGSTNETLTRLNEQLSIVFPGLRISGMYSPPFRALNEEEDQEMVNLINHSDTGIVFVGLGCPKQEKWKQIWLTKVDWWFAYNDLSAGIVRSLGYPEERITSVQNAIDTR